MSVGASNFKHMRARLSNTTSAALPFLGMYLMDLTFIAEGNQNEKEKEQLVARVLNRIETLQHMAYPKFEVKLDIAFLLFFVGYFFTIQNY